FRAVLHMTEGFDIGNTAINIPGAEKKRGGNQLFNRIGIGSRRIENHDTFFGVIGNRNIVDTGASATNGENRGRYHLIMELLAAQNAGLRLLQPWRNVIAVAGKTVKPRWRSSIVSAHFKHANYLQEL